MVTEVKLPVIIIQFATNCIHSSNKTNENNNKRKIKIKRGERGERRREEKIER